MKRQHPFRRPVLVVFALACLGLVQAQEASVQVMQSPTLGSYLAGPDGMTLYIFTRDQPNVSNCYDQCAVNWPPLLASDQGVAAPEGLPGEFGTTERTDGTTQVTYNGWPLYYWIRDQAAGDTTGQAVGEVWWVANVGPTVQVATHPELGPLLTGANGMTLYLFTRDTADTSNCYDQCAVNWPPLLVAYEPLAPEGLTGDLGTTARTDGALHVTYNGQPLYYWVRDQAPGDATGQGVGEVWYIVEP